MPSIPDGWTTEIYTPLEWSQASDKHTELQAMLETARPHFQRDIDDPNSPSTGVLHGGLKDSGWSVDEWFEYMGNPAGTIMGNIRGVEKEYKFRPDSSYHMVVHYEGGKMRFFYRFTDRGTKPGSTDNIKFGCIDEAVIIADSTGNRNWMKSHVYAGCIVTAAKQLGYGGYMYTGLEGTRATRMKLRIAEEEHFVQWIYETVQESYIDSRCGLNRIVQWHYFR